MNLHTGYGAPPAPENGIGILRTSISDIDTRAGRSSTHLNDMKPEHWTAKPRTSFSNLTYVRDWPGPPGVLSSQFTSLLVPGS